ncbi:hypothetical protein RU639_010620 [Aspergillus parasiticus]
MTSIYLVGFPCTAVNPDRENLPLPQLISYLIPEARVSNQDIFHSNVTSEPENRDAEGFESESAEQSCGKGYDGKRRTQDVQGASQMVDNEEKAHRGQRPTLSIPEESTLAPSISMDITQNQNTVTGRKLRQRDRIIHYLSPAWIEQEALSLLRTIKQDVTHGKYDKGASIVLSGFGFGGIVGKRAVTIANTTPEYYDVTLRIYSLVLFATPYGPSTRLAWEDVLMDMTLAADRDYRRKLSRTLTALVDYVFRLSDAFCILEPPVMGKLGRFGNELGEVIEWQDEDFNSLAWCNVGDLPKLKALRTQFAPAHLLNSARLSGIYPGKDICANNSIQVIGLSECGTLDLVKIIWEETRQNWPVVLHENFMSPSEKPLPTLHGMYTGMLHQIVSQRPALFRPIQTLAADILHQDIWTEQNVLVLLKVVLRHCRNIWFLIVIHEFERWPFAIKSWWSETLRQILGSRGSTVTFLTSSASVVSGLTQSKPHTIFVEAEYEQHKRQFAKEWSEELLAHIAGPLTFKDSLRHRLESLVAQTQLFDGSIATLSSYIEKVFSSITLNTTDAITSALEESPQTMEQLYKREILTLRAKPLVQAWAASAVSWVLWSVQPLQVEELATAVAINLDDSDICQVRPKISIAMRQDLQMHLSAFVRMENQPGDSQDPVFQFLDYACRYWPAHFLSAKKPDPDLISAAVEFLLDPEIAKLWFELYLLSTSPFDLHPHNDEHVTETAGVASEAGSRLVESDLEREYDPEITHSIKPMDNQQSAVRMACCIGLRAASGGCLKTAQVLLDLLDDPGQIDRDGRTPLHLATLGGHVEIVRLLLGKCEVTDTKKRTDIPHIIDAQDGKRQTPLMLASQMGHIDCARHLIESGADISIKDAIGKTVVHYAVLNCPEIIKYVAGQYSMYSIDNEGCTPLHIAAKYGSVEATSILLSVLLRSEKPTQTIKALDNAKKTALTHAAEKGHTEVHAGELYAAELAAADGHLVTLRVLIEHHSEKRMIKDAILGDHLPKEC